jgi:hypothetical protein
MLIPTTKTFTFQEDLGNTELNDGVRDPINFLYQMPKCAITMSVDLSIGTGGSNKLIGGSGGFDTETMDNDSMHDTVTNSSRLIFQTAGTYLVGAQAAFASNATGRREIEIRLNAAGNPASGNQIARGSVPATNGATILSCSRPFSTSAGSYIELFAFQDSGGALNVLAGASNTFLWAVMQTV